MIGGLGECCLASRLVELSQARVEPCCGPLTHTVREAVGDDVKTVILFGSIARGEARPNSASTSRLSPRKDGTAAPTWRTLFVPGWATTATCLSSPRGLHTPVRTDEPVVRKILTEGIALSRPMGKRPEACRARRPDRQTRALVMRRFGDRVMESQAQPCMKRL
jgi:hypothetical protein